MNHNFFLVFILILIKVTFCFKEWWEESKVYINNLYQLFLLKIQAIELNNFNFDDYVGKDNYVIVEFYTKWCQYCKFLSPVYDQIVEEYKEKRKDIIISRLEGQENDFTLQRYGIFRFPVIALFKPKSKHIYTIYQRERSFEELKKWINETCPAIIENKKENNNIENNNKEYKINMSEYENQNLTTEDEYITNEFININKRIDGIKNKLGLNANKTIKIRKEVKKIRFEFELSPIIILLFFICSLVVISLYSAIKKFILNNKEHIKQNIFL